MHPSPNDRDAGYLLIADMEASTDSKYRFYPDDSYDLVIRHNRQIVEICGKFKYTTVSEVQGDGVHIKFGLDKGDDYALFQCLRAAASIIDSFRRLPALDLRSMVTYAGNRSGPPEPFRLRTKLTIHRIDDAYRYSLEPSTFTTPLHLGRDLDLAFRLSSMSFRMQTLASRSVIDQLLRHATLEHPFAASVKSLTADEFLIAASRLRDLPGHEYRRSILDYRFRLQIGKQKPVYVWLTDARAVTRLKGIPQPQDLFLLSFEDPNAAIGATQRRRQHESPRLSRRFRIKLRQNFHAVVMVGISLDPGQSDDDVPQDISHLVRALEKGGRYHLDAELTLCVAAKVYGDFDFMFRVSCVDDVSLRHFFETIQSDERYKVGSIDIRQTLNGRFWVNPDYEGILERWGTSNARKPASKAGVDDCHVILTWFDRDPNRDLLGYFVNYGSPNGKRLDGVDVLEAGEVLHHRPFYALLLCRSLSRYEEFFRHARISSTTAQSYIALPPTPRNVQLRYHLVDGIFIAPPRLSEQ